jgi:streptogramin lyase
MTLSHHPATPLALTRALVCIAVLGSIFSPFTQALQVTEFPLEPHSKPYYITTGPDGNLWFIDNGNNKIGRMTPSGEVTEYDDGLSSGDGLSGIAPGPDGNVWFTESKGHQIGRITPQGTITRFADGLTEEPEIYGITAGPEGNMWFTETFTHKIGVINLSTYKITEFPAPGGAFTSIVKGPEGNLWYTNSAEARVSRMTPTGMAEEFSPLSSKECSTPAEANCPYPDSIVVGGDGNLWVDEGRGNAIGRITPLGGISEFSTGLTANAAVADMATGPEGNVWFTENAANQIGWITPTGAITEFSTGLAPDSGPYGIVRGPEENLWVTQANAGEIARVIPNVPPIVSTGGASAISKEAATLSGTVRSRGTDTHYDFEYGPTASYGTQTPQVDNGSGDDVQPVSAALAALSPANMYHYRLVAVNTNGTTYGAEQLFTTGSVPPPPPPRPKVTVGAFEMYFSGYRAKRGHAQLLHIVVLKAARGERVSYICKRCQGSSTHGSQLARSSKIIFDVKGLIVSARSFVQITVTGTNGSRRVRTYGFNLRLTEEVLKSQQCFLPGRGAPVVCPSPPKRGKKSKHGQRVKHGEPKKKARH